MEVVEVLCVVVRTPLNNRHKSKRLAPAGKKQQLFIKKRNGKFTHSFNVFVSR